MEEEKGIKTEEEWSKKMSLEAPQFARIKKVGPCNDVPDKAQLEWDLVKSAEDAKKWHAKWTPWFTKDMIEGIVKYGYTPK